MNMQTRIIEKRAVTFMQAGDNGVHVNRITMPVMPWEKPEQEPEHKRPADDRQFKLTTPKIERRKPQSPQRDRFAEWDQDLLRDEWEALCRAEGHKAGMPPDLVKQQNAARQGAAKRLPQTSRTMVMLLEKLRHGDIRRDRLLEGLGHTGNSKHHRERAFQMEWIKGGTEPDAMICLTTAGHIALAAMRKEPQ
jgi:hypothetical protein